MAEFLPIYQEPPKAAVEQEKPRDRCATCHECSFSGLPNPTKLTAAIKREVLKRYRSLGQKAIKADVDEEVAATLEARIDRKSVV